jgi:hypothetical protein
LRPTSTSLTNPLLLIEPPAGDASKTPLIFGGKGVTVSYVLSSSGEWLVGVGTDDLFGQGDYILRVSCGIDPEPLSPQNCVTQEFICGQTAEWNLTNQSCRFATGNRVYNDFHVYGVAGDVLNIEMSASAFTPLFGIYDSRNTLLAQSGSPSGSRVTATFLVPRSGDYYIAATSNQESAAGFFSLSLKCSASGCLEPLIFPEPSDMSVPFGSRASVTVSVNAATTVSYEWYDAGSLPTLVASSPTLVTAPVTQTQTYYLRVTTVCGDATSRTFRVIPTISRHRAARH